MNKLTPGQLKKDYPNTWDHFSAWFDSNGQGAYGADDLTQLGFDFWFPRYSDVLRVGNLDEYENKLETI